MLHFDNLLYGYAVNSSSYSSSQIVGLISGPVAFFLIWTFFSPAGLSAEGCAVLAATVWIAIWWMTEAVPIPVTSLLPILLLPITGALDNKTVTSAYGNDIVYLFLGGFFIATAMEKWDLHRRIALSIIAVVGTGTQRILLGFMLATAFLSMWVSNTAAVMMMVPMALAISSQTARAVEGRPEATDIPAFEKSLLFGVGYAGTIGGLATLIGTPPNIILAAQARELFGVEISFATLMMVGVPVATTLLLVTWIYLGRFAFRMSFNDLPGGRELIRQQQQMLGPITAEEKAVSAVFVFAAFFWITRSLIWTKLFPQITDGMVAVTAAVLLFAIPSTRSEGGRILGWADSRTIPWGILLLFGGGLAIAAGFRETGLSSWLGSQLTVLDGLPILLVIAFSSLFILFLTEITSNTATATMILPVIASFALALNLHPFALMIPCAMAANCAFMLPVGTPPNAIIFATEKLRINEMMRVGLLLNLFAAALITVAVYYLVPPVFDLDLETVPAAFRCNAQLAGGCQ